MSKNPLTPLDPVSVSERLKAGEMKLVDIREPDEYAQEHIPGAVSLPLSGLQKSGLHVGGNEHVVFHCKSGMRTNANCDALAAQVDGEAYVMQGGLQAWKKAGLPVEKGSR